MLHILIFILAITGAVVLVFHITVELNTIEHRSNEFTEKIKRHYGPEESD